MSTYLKKFYLNDRKLAQRALLEFHRALKSDRMIAFTGAMTTVNFGYPSWNSLIDKMAVETKIVATKFRAMMKAEEIEAEFARFKKLLSDHDKRVGLSMMGELLDQFDRSDNDPITAGELAISAQNLSPIHYKHLQDQFGSRREYIELFLAHILRKPVPNGDVIDIPKSLWRDIGINRIATLNYDFELERLLMLTPDEINQIGEDKDKLPTILHKLVDMFRRGQVDWSDASNRLTRIMPNGRTIISDILSRDRSDRFIDFAMGSDDAEQHVLHLHGRADVQKSLVFSYRDYNQLYRRNDLHRQPFEYGQRIMMGGNPILFVGLGMDETEINRTLEDFISNTPYHRSAPTFLLWNTRRWNKKDGKAEQMDDDEKANFRTDKLHRLGVFTIFDTDVLDDTGLSELKCFTGEHDQNAAIFNVKLLTSKVAVTARSIGQRERYIGKNWRSMATRMASAEAGAVATLWSVDYNGSLKNASLDKDVGLINEKLIDNHVQFAIASAGWGKGQIGSLLADAEKEVGGIKKHVLHINASFCFDTDSFLDAIARFLEKITPVSIVYTKDSVPQISRDEFFSRINLVTDATKNATCIINGIDRFIDVHGVPLSAEFDRFIHQLIEDSEPNKKPYGPQQPKIQWVFLGSDRARLYLAREQWADKYLFELSTANGNSREENTETLLASAYLQAIKKKMENFKPSAAQDNAIKTANETALDRSGEARRISIERLRRAFFDAYLEPEALKICCVSDTGLAIEILRALAFIGLPAEADVLKHVPRIFKMLDGDDNGKLTAIEAGKIKPVLDTLVALQLVIKINGFEDYTAAGKDTPSRYGLHRAVMAEMRHRLGLPLSEAKLSTAFNMSLYVAQPVDGYIPEPDIHDELGDLIDALISAYKTDTDESDEPIPMGIDAFFKALDNPPYGFGEQSEDHCKLFDKRCKANNMACMRAALSVVRGYYSTTGLLTLDRNDRLIGEERDGILLEHVERLDDLIDAYGKAAKLRDVLRDKFPDNFETRYGTAEPFYPDELVWLHNERGVVRLAMGDLPEANRSFQKALTINKLHVEFGDRSHNWRRIKLNQLTVEIERGELHTAERMAREILEASGWLIDWRVKSMDEAERKFKKIKKRSKEKVDGNDRFYFLAEDRLAIAITLGYRGMCANLRGEMLDARDDLAVATEALRKLDEQRAFAYFSRLFAWALREMGEPNEADRIMDIALDAAQSTRQMDLVYRTQIMRAQWNWEKPGSGESERRKAAVVLSNAIDYGVKADVYRVRTEAASSLSKLKIATGDYEVALQYAAESMTIATRYSNRLRMMSVRLRLGEIMIKRGDIQTGRSLIYGAIKSANRSGFQRIVDAGQATLDGIN
jgi:tetratricopeptide (TPR) repeat protein